MTMRYVLPDLENAMATIPVPNVAQLEAIYSMNGQVVENVFHYQMPAPTTANDLTLFAVAWIAEWVTNIKPYINVEVSLTQVKVTDLTTNISPTITTSSTLPQAGTQTGALMPNNVSCVFTKRTNLRGRSQRGRVYWPGFGEPACINNVITPALVTAIIAGLDNLRAVSTGLGVWEMVVVSRYTGGQPRVSGIFTPITNFTSDGVVDSQRRRLPGRGN